MMKMTIRRYAMLLLGCTGIAASGVEAAEWKGLEGLQLHAFGSQSFLYSDDNQFFGDSDDGSFRFYELGGNFSWEATSRLRFSGQALIRDAGTSDSARPRIDYLFGEYRFVQTEDLTASVKLGRVLNPYGFYSATRDVAGTRPGILLPQSVYVDANRQFSLSADGVQLSLSKVVGRGELLFEIEKTEPRTSDPDLEATVLGAPRPGRLEGDRGPSWLGKVSYDYDFGRWKFAWTQGKVYVDYVPGANDFLPPGELYFRPTVLSVQHQREHWGFTTEWMRRQATVSGFGMPTGVETAGDNFYVQADYRFNQLSVFLRYDELIRDNDDRWGKGYEAVRGVPAYTRYAKDWTVGGRWDINQRFAFNAELHMVEGAAWLSVVENKGIPPAKHWNLFLMSVSARF